MARRRDDPRQLFLFDPSKPPPPAEQPPPPGVQSDTSSSHGDTSQPPPAESGAASPNVRALRSTSSPRHHPARVSPAPAPDEHRRLAAQLPANVRLGTSSWSFPGWAGLVYDGAYSERDLARGGLAAYASHPLLKTVGVDKTYYRPIESRDFHEMAAHTPDDFRFLVKAASLCTSPTLASGARASRRGPPNPRFLDPAYAADVVIAPFVEGLADKAGVLVFQFSAFAWAARRPRRAQPADDPTPRDAGEFIDLLHAFLAALPRGAPLAVEVRDADVWCDDYRGVLRECGVAHCFNVHPHMPSVAAQAADWSLERDAPSAGCVVRWMLHEGETYEGARERYAPFDRIVDEDAESRRGIAALAWMAARAGVPVTVVVNNKAEGSAPLTVFKLASEIRAQQAP